jgi:hypothetical protein
MTQGFAVLEAGQHLDPIHPRHHDIQKHQVDITSGKLQGLGAVSGFHHVMPEDLDHGTEKLTVHGFVIDDQDA